MCDALLVLGSLAVGVGAVFLYGTVRGGSEAGLDARQSAAVFGGLTPPAPNPGARSQVVAVESFLDAAVSGDAGTAFNLLSAEDRASLPNPEAWAARRAATFGAVVSWSWVTGSPARELATMVRSVPALSPTSGWKPAETVVVWKLVDEDGWRVSLGASTEEPVVAPAEGAVLVARQWLGDPDRCAPGSATAAILGMSTYPGQFGRLCDPEGSPPGLPEGAASAAASGRVAADFGTRYGSDASTWARVVPLPDESLLLLAAIGDQWVVIDVVPRS